jgi:hypothetical protein
MERIEHSPEIFRERATHNPAPGKCHDPHAITRLTRQGIDQALGRLDRRRQPIGNSVFDSHAPAHIDRKHHIMPRRQR